MGFTLVELLVTLVIVALLASLATVAIGRYSAAAARRQWADKVESFIYQARNSSVRYMCPVHLFKTPQGLEFNVCDQFSRLLIAPNSFGVTMFVDGSDRLALTSKKTVTSIWLTPQQPLSGGWVDVQHQNEPYKSIDFRSAVTFRDALP